MTSETITKIRYLLQQDVSEKKERMLRDIESGYDKGLDVAINEYRTSYRALKDFEDWEDEQED